MLNQNNVTSGDDDSGSGEYVLLDAAEAEEAEEEEEGTNASQNDEEEEEEETTTTSANNEESPSSSPEPTESFLEEASDMLLEQSVDGPQSIKGDESLQEGDDDVISNDEEKEPLLSDDALSQDIDIDPAFEPAGSKVFLDDNRSDDDTQSQAENESADKNKESREAGDIKELTKEHDPKKKDDNVEADSVASNEDDTNQNGKGNADAEDEDDMNTTKENAKENTDPEEENKNTTIAKDFKFGTRGEVNGAAIVFGVTALLIAGPVIALVWAAAAAHIAANKPCKCAEFTRRSGGVVDNIGKKKRLERAAKRVEEGAQAPKPHIWDKITDRLVEGGEWTENIIIPRRGRHPCRRPLGRRIRLGKRAHHQQTSE